MNLINKILKIMIYLVIILNISTLILGYNLIDEKFENNRQIINQEKDKYFKEEDEILEKIDILSNSKEDLNSNLISFKSQSELLKEKLNESVNTIESGSYKKDFYLNKKAKLLEKNKLLIKEKGNVNAKLKNQKQLATETKKVKRTTRSS